MMGLGNIVWWLFYYMGMVAEGFSTYLKRT
jgi:hypothetical protein